MKIEMSLSKGEAEAILRGTLASVWKDREGGTYVGGYQSKVLQAADSKLKKAIEAAALRDTGGQTVLDEPGGEE